MKWLQSLLKPPWCLEATLYELLNFLRSIKYQTFELSSTRLLYAEYNKKIRTFKVYKWRAVIWTIDPYKSLKIEVDST